MKKLITIIAALVLAGFLCGVAVAGEIPQWFKPMAGKAKVLCSDMPKYPGFKWSAPRLVRDIYEKKVYSFTGTNRVKGINPEDVADYYEAIMKKRGWTTLGPAGGATSLGMTFKKGGREIRVSCYSTPNGGTDEPVDPRGTMIFIVY